MSMLESLPSRPLSEKDVTVLNRSGPVDLAIAVGDESPTNGVLLATDDWVKGLAFDGEHWRVVKTVDLDESERFDALQSCEEAVRQALESGDTF